MAESNVTTVDVKRLRFTFAINHFKRLVLGDRHIPGKHQSRSMFEAIAKLFADEPFSDRAWQSWFSGASITMPQVGTINTLDEVAARFLLRDCRPQAQQELAARGFFKQLVRGGLISSMTSRTKAKYPLDTLMARANGYRPLTSVHLHFDAVEVASWAEDFQGLPWESVARIAARRILDILAEQWGPREGRLYSEFPSDFRLRWDAADEGERARITASLARMKSNSFERFMDAGAHPDWLKIGCKADIAAAHIYKLLFALAADPEFLVAGRLDAWALDLATASLAMYALAWTNRYTTMGLRTQDEKLFWLALDKVYFDPDAMDSNGRELQAAMGRCQASWSQDCLECFSEARDIYLNLLSEGGISAQEIRRCAMTATAKHPLRYYGG